VPHASSESEILSARLSRMKALIESLEAEFSQSAKQRETFMKLKREVDESRKSLELIK
jgi:hypothetical protein